MNPKPPSYNNPEFDAFAEEYDSALNQGLSVSGEKKEYFARGRVDWLGRCLRQLRCQPREALDFGCGTGAATPFLLGLPGLERVTGVEVSPKSLAVAKRLHGSERARFCLSQEFDEANAFGLAFCNGVFHHIPPANRLECLRYVARALRPGALFSLWENNPWNPGTRHVMSRIPFDRDAIPLSVLESRRLLQAAGFEIVRCDFLFIFPGFLKALRFIEPWLCKAPLGAQYQVLARKP